MTSTIGVTLISLMTPRRGAVRPDPAALAGFIAIVHPFTPARRSAATGSPNSSQTLQPLGLLVHFGREFDMKIVAGMAATSNCGRKQPPRCPAPPPRAGIFDAAIDWKLVIMPQTVPKRPIKGQAEPTVAAKEPAFGRSTSRDGHVHDLLVRIYDLRTARLA